MKDREDMALDTTMNVVVDVVVDPVVEEHTLDVDVNADVASNTEAGNTVTYTGTVHIPAQKVKLPAQSTRLQQHLQT